MHKIPFSLVTTCRNEIKSLPRWKQNIQDQTRQPDEIVIVDAFSDDGTFEYLTEWANSDARLKIIQKRGAAAYGRNIAIENTQFDHILSTDMGVRLAKVWCEKLIVPFEKDNSIDFVIGNTCIDVETVLSGAAKAELVLEDGGIPDPKVSKVPGNRSVAYKKYVWEKVGKLPEDLTFYADDSVFGRQLIQEGFKFVLAPDAMTYWGRPEKLKHFFHENFVYGKGDGEAFIKTPLAFKWYLKRRIPKFVVPFLNTLINFLKRGVYKAMGRAMKKKDLLSCCIIPVLVAGRTYHYAKGYIIGYDSGNKNCTECRSRLKRNKEGYSLI